MPAVLLAAPDDGVTARYVARAMQAEGWRGALYDYRHIAASRLAMGQKAAVEAANEGLFDLCATRNPDALLILKGELVWPSTIRRISACGVKTAVWNFDPWQQREGWVVERAAAADHFFTIAKGLVPYFQDQGAQAHWLSEGCDPLVHKPTGASMAAYPVSFVGTVEGVVGRPEWWARIVDRFGKDAHLFGSFPAAFESHGRAEPGDVGLSEVVSATAVNLGRDRCPEVERSYGARLYRTLAAGGFLLTNRTKGIERDFPGCMGVYDSDAECVELAAHYLEHPEVRQRVAREGRRVVLGEHTFQHRMRDFARVMKL